MECKKGLVWGLHIAGENSHVLSFSKNLTGWTWMFSMLCFPSTSELQNGHFALKNRNLLGTTEIYIHSYVYSTE